MCYKVSFACNEQWRKMKHLIDGISGKFLVPAVTQSCGFYSVFQLFMLLYAWICCYFPSQIYLKESVVPITQAIPVKSTTLTLCTNPGGAASRSPSISNMYRKSFRWKVSYFLLVCPLQANFTLFCMAEGTWNYTVFPSEVDNKKVYNM